MPEVRLLVRRSDCYAVLVRETAVAAGGGSSAVRVPGADHPCWPMVRLETATRSGRPAAMHPLVSLQETPSDPCSTSATVILGHALGDAHPSAVAAEELPIL